MSITIKDVAAKAGVSTATVSKVINNSPSIPDTTADRIRAIMEEMNYHPNKRAQNFASRKTGIILFAVHFRKNIAFENPHLFEIMTGLEKALEGHGYVLNLINVNSENCVQELREIIARKSVDGIVLHISVVSRELEKVILKEQFPHICIGCPEHKTRLCWIDNNNVSSGEIATEFLYRNGCRKIAFLGGNKTDVGSEKRKEGFLSYLEQKKIAVPKEYLFYGESTIESGMEGMQKFLSLRDRPEAVVCANNNMALGAMYEISDRGLKAPDDIGLITFDAFPYTKITRPRLTTVDIDVYDMGKLAGDMIIRKIKKPNFEVQSFSTLANLIVGGTVRIRE